MFLLESLGREQNAPLKSSIFDLWKFGDVASFLPDEAQRHGWNIANKKILFSVKRLFPCLACKVLKWTSYLDWYTCQNHDSENLHRFWKIVIKWDHVNCFDVRCIVFDCNNITLFSKVNWSAGHSLDQKSKKMP